MKFEETRQKNKKFRKNQKRTINKYGKMIEQSILKEEFMFQTTERCESKSYEKIMI